MYDIKKEEWHTCKICNEHIKESAKKYGGSGVYYVDVFEKHLNEHGITVQEYFAEICEIEKPKCMCGICNNFSKISKNRKGFLWRKFVCGRNPGILEWSEKAKKNRKGEKNPMYGLKPWNKGLTKENSESLKAVSEKNTGKKMSLKSKEKMSLSALKRKVHGHTGQKHSEETKRKLSRNTLKMIKDGKYKQTKTKPHLEVGKILQKLKIEYKEEYISGIFSFDYYLNDLDILLEVDGDYFHSNPKIYPDGPKTKTQKINFYRDIKKNKYCDLNKIKLIRFWESDILNNPKYIEEELCRLSQ